MKLTDVLQPKLLIALALLGVVASFHTPKTQAQGTPNVNPTIQTATGLPTGTLTIDLPPKIVFTPNQLYFGGDTYTFNSASNTFSGPSEYSVAATLKSQGGTADYYEVVIANFEKGKGKGSITQKPLRSPIANFRHYLDSLTQAEAYSPPPAGSICFIFRAHCAGTTTATSNYGLRITFQNTSKSNLSTLTNFIFTTSNYNNAFIGGAACDVQDHNAATGYLCTQTKVQMTTSDPKAPTIAPLTMTERLDIDKPAVIQFQGNVGAAGTLSGFSFSSSKALAIGGNLSALSTSNQKISNYVNKVTTLSWANIAANLTDLFNRSSNAQVFAASTFAGQSWNLNSPTNDPTVGSATTFSATPEGKLWRVNNSLTFTGSTLTFNGSGTLAVDGDVTFNSGSITCNGRLGIIATGSITFGPNVTTLCGAFVALGTKNGGNISFNQTLTSSRTWTTILVAKNNIALPKITDPNVLTINYYNDLANKPTVLFGDLLNIVYSSPS